MRISIQKFIIASLSTFVAVSFVVSAACKKELSDTITDNSTAVPDLSQSHTYNAITNRLAELGRVLFYDKNLSLNNSTSCGSCHKQQHGFADNQQFSRGLMGKLSTRNTSSLINTSSFIGSTTFFWDGRAASINEAVLMPVLNQDEMHAIDLQYLPEKLNKLSYYPQLFINAFGSEEITVPRIRQALAEFINVMVSVSSRVNSVNGTALSPDETQGELIFRGKAKCISCHTGTDFTGYSGLAFFNIGLDYEYPDKGRFYVTGNEKDKGSFKMPSLRNVGESAPYMHDGRFSTLREVIDHYDHGIKNNPHLSFHLRDIPQSVLQNIPPNVMIEEVDFSMYPPQSLNLTEVEKRQLEAYLRATSDPVLLYDPKYSDPFRR
jgi:cytochrome c peroxidase